jgi:hypothetical protein
MVVTYCNAASGGESVIGTRLQLAHANLYCLREQTIIAIEKD